MRFTRLACAVALIPTTLFAQLIAPTDPLTPDQERLKLRVPQGFKVQLVAAEPDIQKPMNLKFDAAGRLWVTHSVEYPFPVKEGQKGRDGITVLSDFGPDGRARKIQRFAEGLNIPIGIVPVKDGVIVWSIPNVLKLTDTDGDMKADKTEVLYTGFEAVDTHGNQNGFTRWIDGWIYACHGFRNHSKVRKGVDGPVVLDMESGNGYRFKEDGSAIEQWTFGQVNPFGLTFDPLGNLYTADCHSRPLTMLIRGAHYPSFGKPHDGLGFAPELINHDHGSTGIAGIAYYDAGAFPNAYRDCLYTGNVITNRVHRDALIWHGSTPKADTKEDFIVSDDPWFHPVDVQLGPDGALYVCDFYNRIIGHYEVPLEHPGRDRERGRLWRVVSDNFAAVHPPDLTQLGDEALLARLSDPNLTVRALATNYIVDHRPDALQTLKSKPTAVPLAHVVWAAERTTGVSLHLADDPSRLVRIQVMKIAAERPKLNPEEAQIVRHALADKDPFVARAAAGAAARHLDTRNVQPLLSALAAAPKDDEALIHAIRLALRDHMKQPTIAQAVNEMELTGPQRFAIAEVALAAANDQAAAFLFDYIQKNETDRGLLLRALPNVARAVRPDRVDALASFVRQRFADDKPFQLTLLSSTQQSLRERGIAPSAEVRAWALELVTSVLKTTDFGWTSFPNPAKPTRPIAWSVRPFPIQGGGSAPLLVSHPPEPLTGVLRSRNFTIPDKLALAIAGHDGVPDSPASGVNYVRLVRADTGEEIARQAPPRNDTAQRYEWDLSHHAGKPGYVELVDGHTSTGFAWLAAGGFEPPLVAVPSASQEELSRRQGEALRLIGALGLTELAGVARDLLADRAADPATRGAAAAALREVDPPALVTVLGKIAADATEPDAVRLIAADTLGQSGVEGARGVLLSAMTSAPGALQGRIAVALAATPAGAGDLLAAVEQGKASARLLQARPVVERLRASGAQDLDARIEKLTKDLPPADASIAKAIDQRKAAFYKLGGDATRGQAVFQRICAACHQIAGQGARIGPTLDGVGYRGVDRLLEDIVDPNRNIDAAFRFVTVTTKDSRVLAGLPLRTEGGILILADNTGKEQRIAEADIANRVDLKLSLMPVALPETMPEQEFNDLVAYLLSLKPEPTK